MTAELYSCSSENKDGGEEEKAVAAQESSMCSSSPVVYALHACINNHRLWGLFCKTTDTCSCCLKEQAEKLEYNT